MKNYVGIDLGTTNSAICTFDGETVRIWKSPRSQGDVTPSAIYIDRRGNRHYGLEAYNQAPADPNNSATLFKRFMGTNTKMNFDAAKITLTPEECSAEILKVLYGYLPEEIRNDSETATVITVPAAFNQVKKDATLQAAKLAGINRVALMQEPVAAVMSVMRVSKQEGIFLVYDLGGGTFDVSIAENVNGRVNLLAHGGIEMCGGRDIDRMLFNQIVVPWIKSNFELPDDLLVNRKYKTFCRIAQWATERAKIELSSTENSVVSLSEMETRAVDENGKEMYLDVEINRNQMNNIISDLEDQTITATRETLEKAGLTANDLEKIVFVGGPTNYKPLRDKVCFEIMGSERYANIDVNPMTAVAEGASIFAESIDWTNESHNRKNQNETIDTDISLSFKYEARTPNDHARVMCILGDPLNGYTVSFTSENTGWSSGNAVLKNNQIIDLPLPISGENSFIIKVLDEFGREKPIGNSRIVITRTLATVGAIPASHSVGVEVLEKLGGTPVLKFLVNEGDPLPKKGTMSFKAAQTIRAGSNDTLNIKLWEGNIQSPIDDNRWIGVFKISGTDFDSGVIPTGEEIECEYEMTDSGTIYLEPSVPCIGASFAKRNFFASHKIDLDDIDSISEQGQLILNRIDEMEQKVTDKDLTTARDKAASAANLAFQPDSDPETVQKAYNDLLEAKKYVNRARQNNLSTIRQMELDSCVSFFNEKVKEYATQIEIQTYENLTRTAQRAIDGNDPNFDNILENMRSKNTSILVRQDWFIIDWYRYTTSSPSGFMNKSVFAELKRRGDAALAADDIDQLRAILGELLRNKVGRDSGHGMFDVTNIVAG